ncbi:alpha/beta hydrolase [Naasia sp. SYSU D00948]|uniref:alpha/beta hydrolase n=1 Tax=Naasia sp. SYSU D00948 TaxID=2817379 RepID=UPI001FEF5D69|nr:alpha/beta hydrolase [Naasia sp. SYSU D00948]
MTADLTLAGAPPLMDADVTLPAVLAPSRGEVADARPGREGRHAPEEWEPDVLGAGYEQLTLPLGEDDEGEVAATLVRHTPARPVAGPLADVDVLYVHGWSDYFFQTHVAEWWAGLGARFHALDLRKYGRSLRSWQTPGFVNDLAVYDADLEAALAAIGQGAGGARDRRIVLVGHSTGGLTLSLWAHRHPGRAAAVVLNSPWLEFQGDSVGRLAITPMVTLRARFRPQDVLPRIDLGHYARTLLRDYGGEWDYDRLWRPEQGFPVTPAWLAAILEGHAAVARGLDIDAPVFVWLSRRSALGPFWSERMRTADVAIDVDEVAQRAMRLGSVVTVTRIEDAVHDVMLSRASVRAKAEDQLRRWLAAYVA